MTDKDLRACIDYSNEDISSLSSASLKPDSNDVERHFLDHQKKNSKLFTCVAVVLISDALLNYLTRVCEGSANPAREFRGLFGAENHAVHRELFALELCRGVEVDKTGKAFRATLATKYIDLGMALTPERYQSRLKSDLTLEVHKFLTSIKHIRTLLFKSSPQKGVLCTKAIFT
jgi:hypothetical protein